MQDRAETEIGHYGEVTQMKLIGRLLSVLIVLGAVAALCLPADAGAYVYSGKRKKVNCGIVEITDPSGTVSNEQAIQAVTNCSVTLPDGTTRIANLFAKLDSLNSMKPAGWTFENPLAKTQNKFDPAYWRIRAGSARNLTRMNVLYLPGSGNMTLTDEERENLRRFVDGGGVLWVDNVSGTSTLKFGASGPFFISQLSFTSGGSGLDMITSRYHPLVSTPYWLTDMEAANLGMNAGGNWSRCYCDMGTGGITGDLPLSFDVLFPIIDSLSSQSGFEKRPSVVANAYGSGRVVATANAVGKACMMPDPYCLPSLKFAFNIMSYASTWTDLRKDPRHSGASIDTLGSNRLVEKWVLEEKAGQPAAPAADRESGALIYKSTVFYTAGNTLYALEQNGDTHGGVYTADDRGAVIMWKWQGAGTLSPPTIATIQDPADSCTPTEAVLVMDSGGEVAVLKAFPMNAAGILPPGQIQPIYSFPTEAGSQDPKSKWPSPPIYINGWIYALSGGGRLYAVNPCLEKWAAENPNDLPQGLSATWQTPSLTGPPFAASPRSGPSFGFMKNAFTGAVVGTVFWFTSAPTIPVQQGQINDRVHAIPVSVSMDRVRIQNRDATGTSAEIRVSYPGYLTSPDPNHSKTAIRMFQSDGVTPIVLTDSDVDLNKNLAGVDVLDQGMITVHASQRLPANPLIYASYSLSYSLKPGQPMDLEIEPKSPDGQFAHPATLFPGTPCLGQGNTVYLTGTREHKSDRPSAGGSILAYRQDTGASSGGILTWHYLLHSGLNASDFGGYAPGLPVVELPGVVRHQVPGGPSGATQPMVNPQPCSSPVVAGNKLFVTVSGDSGGPRGALMCFKASPEFVIRITESAGYDREGKAIKRPKNLWKKTDEGHYTVKIWQPNLIDPPSGGIPVMDARGTSGGISVDYDQGTITFTNFASTKLSYRGMFDTNTFSPSLPVWVWLDNVEVPIDWSTWGPGAFVPGGTNTMTAATSDSVDLSGWNNLMWYFVVPDTNGKQCSGAHAPPIVIGNTVYFVTDDGILFALDTETGEATSKETDKKEIWSEEIAPGMTLGGTKAVSVSGSNGALMVPGPDGLHAFTNTTTLVADNNRVVEVDGAGEVIWAVDSVTWPGFVPTNAGEGMAAKQGSVNKPARARYVNTGEILFANTGTNQVCKIDKGGMVGFEGASGQYVRWVYDKFIDPKHMLRPGQPRQLRAPTDAIMWQEIEPPVVDVNTGTSVVHCVIADSGNSRVLDLVYRVRGGRFVNYNGDPVDASYIDPESGFVLPELNWASRTDSLNERYAFDCLQLVTTPKGNTMCQEIWVASSNFSANAASNGKVPKGGAGMGGAILALGYRERTLSTGQMPPAWNYAASTSGMITATCDRVDLGKGTVSLANPRYFSVTDGPLGRSLMICDNYGVYEVDITQGNDVPEATYVLLEKAYRGALRSFEVDPRALSGDPSPSPVSIEVPLQATSVQRLPTGRWLIANSYSGSNTTGSTKFNGEVFEYDPRGEKITWSAPRLQWINATGTWKQTSSNTYDLRQPKSASRQ